LLGLWSSYKWGQYSRLSTARTLQAAYELADKERGAHSSDKPAAGGPWIETISWSPRAWVYHGFLTVEEADHIINLGKDHVYESQVVGTTGQSVKSTARTSSGMFITGAMASDPVVLRAQKRIAQWSQIPEENGESFYLIRYEKGQQYVPHYDYFSNDANGEPFIRGWGNRMATVLLYLQPAEEGGETIFPEASIIVTPKKGDAILFFDMNADGTVDPRSLHGGRPVIKGVKWVMTRWIRQKHF